MLDIKPYQKLLQKFYELSVEKQRQEKAITHLLEESPEDGSMSIFVYTEHGEELKLKFSTEGIVKQLQQQLAMITQEIEQIEAIISTWELKKNHHDE